MEDSISLREYLDIRGYSTHTKCVRCYPIEVWDLIFDIPFLYYLSDTFDIIFIENYIYLTMSRDFDSSFYKKYLLSDEAHVKIKEYERSKKIDKLLDNGK